MRACICVRVCVCACMCVCACVCAFACACVLGVHMCFGCAYVCACGCGPPLQEWRSSDRRNPGVQPQTYEPIVLEHNC